MTSYDLRWPEVTRKWRHLTGSHLQVAGESRKLTYTVHFTPYKAVARRGRQLRDGNWRHVTWGDGKWPGSDVVWPEVTVEGRKLAYTVHFTSYKAAARRGRQSRDGKWHHVTSGDWKCPGSDVIHRKSPGSGYRKPNTGVYCTFHFLEGCSSRGEAVTWQEMSRVTSGDRWVTRKRSHLTGSHLELAVEGWKLAYTVHFTSYKDAARRRRQSRHRKWRNVTSGDRKWPGSDVIWPEVILKWLWKAENWSILYISLPTRL